MADQNSGTKTEQATPKKRRDARKKGDIAKSRDVTNTLLLLFGIILFWQLGPIIGTRLQNFTTLALEMSLLTNDQNLNAIGMEAVKLLLTISAMIVVPMAIFGLLSEFLQTGAVFALEKVKPKLSNLNPISGVKRMFSVDSFFELLKSIAKIIVVIVIAVLTANKILPDAMKLQQSAPVSFAYLLGSQTVMLVGWAMGIFAAVSLLDLSYQKYSHSKKMMMSLQDIKQEYKSSEGDPQIKSQRQQLAREWAKEGATQKAQEATVLVVNPTHVAIALKYDKQRSPVPTVTARGLDNTALAMRTAAQEAGVPVLRNIKLARTLLATTKNGDAVPRALFSIVAEVILWANAVDKKLSAKATEQTTKPAPTAPGEDLSLYPANSEKRILRGTEQ